MPAPLELYMETSSRKTYNENDENPKAEMCVGEGRFVVDVKPSCIQSCELAARVTPILYWRNHVVIGIVGLLAIFDSCAQPYLISVK